MVSKKVVEEVNSNMMYFSFGDGFPLNVLLE